MALNSCSVTRTIGGIDLGMITEPQIRERLIAFLTNAISLDEFEDWLVQNSWNMHHDSDPAAQELVGAIELRLSEYSSDHLSEEQLRNELMSLARRPLIVYLDESPTKRPRWESTSTSASRSVRIDSAEAA